MTNICWLQHLSFILTFKSTFKDTEGIESYVQWRFEKVVDGTSASLSHHCRNDSIEGLGFNGVPRIVERVAHDIRERIV